MKAGEEYLAAVEEDGLAGVCTRGGTDGGDVSSGGEAKWLGD
jgi:hypothetical protein